jgi:WXG100 family type VII secretion target
MAEHIIQAYYDDLEGFARSFAQEAQQTTQLGQVISRLMGDLLAGGWVGVGADQFFREMDDLVLPAVSRLGDALQDGSAAVRRLMEVFKEAEEEAGKCFDLRIINPFLMNAQPKAGDVHIESMTFYPGSTAFLTGTGDGRAVHPNDVSQGRMGNCWMMAPLAGLAQTNPGLIERMIRKNADGSYTVTLYKKSGGKYVPTEINVFPTFPEGKVFDPQTKQWVPANAHAGTGDQAGGQTEIWPMLIEKAYAQMEGGGDALKGYDSISDGGLPTSSGNFMSALTGQPSTSNVIFPTFEELVDMKRDGQIITLGTANVPKFLANDYVKSGQLVGGHQYYVTNIDPVNRTVTVRNPWGWDRGEITIPADDLNSAFLSLNHNPGGPRP